MGTAVLGISALAKSHSIFLFKPASRRKAPSSPMALTAEDTGGNDPFVIVSRRNLETSNSEASRFFSMLFSTSQGASSAAPGGDDITRTQNSEQSQGFWKKWKENSANMSSKLAKLGLSAVLAYGLFDGVTYTSFFVLAFLGYEKSTGKNPAANLQALLGIVFLMWTGNNVTRPFRVAGAAALAPVIDKGLGKLQKYFKYPTLVYSLALVVGIVASLCLTIVGRLILSRWGK